ncbi:hypothetical protein [Massilia aerilata]|uniref:Uncharacterized protein n=1 Tax=Massilia aerilata TaxID=453817 RepID=A0ABW0S6B7_9BURK
MTKTNNPGTGSIAPLAESTATSHHVWATAARECIAAVLSLLIVGFTLYFMWAMFSAPDDVAPMRWQHQSSVLQTALGLTGAVIGYYFARIPAERAVSVAQQKEAAAISSAEQAAESKGRIVGSVQEMHDDYASPHGGGDDHVDGDAMRADIAQRLAQILRKA